MEDQHPIDVNESLATRLSREQSLSCGDAIRLLIVVANQIQSIHESGRFYGNLTGESVLLSAEGGIVLETGGETVCFGRLPADDAICPPALRRDDLLELPKELAVAREKLSAARIPLDPIQIDLYQLGTLLCSLITGESIGAYLRSPRIKGAVPAKLQEIIERTLGYDERDRFAAISEFADALDQLLDKEHDLDDENATSDTAPSIVGDTPRADSTVITNRKNVPRNQDELPFQTLGHYEIRERIGQGGMGDVYKAYERSLDRTVAIKVLPSEFTRHDDFVRRFYAEATAAARLSHPNIIDIYYIGEDQGFHFFSMQYVEGESLSELLSRRKRLPVEEALPIVKQALEGLGAAHKQGLVHRDVKPGNLLIKRENQQILVADFGLVKSLQASQNLTATGMVMGTVDYISPEQGRGQSVDASSDLYSIGVLLYHVLSGKLPFEANSPTAMIFQHVYEKPPPLQEVVPGVPAPLACIVAKLLAKFPEQRYASAAELLRDLNAFENHEPLPSGADVISLEDEAEVPPPGIAVTRLAVKSIPEAGAEAFPEQFEVHAPTGMFRKLWYGFLDRVEERAPEYLDSLQNTQQQLDRAVRTYEKRQADLRKLIAEIEALLQEFETQASEWRVSAVEAYKQAEAAADEETARKALIEQKRRLGEADSSNGQIADQTGQLQDLRSQLSLVTARLESLRSQRDTLNARFEVAQARVRVAGGKVAPPRLWHKWFRFLPRPWMRTAAAIWITLVLAIALAIPLSHRFFRANIPTGPNEDRVAPASDTAENSLLSQYHAGNPINLLQLDNLKGVLDGKFWSFVDGQLKCSPTVGNPLFVPYTPPRHYILRATIQRDAGINSFGIGFPMGSGNTSFILDGWEGQYSGLHLLDGYEAIRSNNETRVIGTQLTNGKPAELQIIVLSDRIRVSLDGKQLVNWTGQPERLSANYRTSTSKVREIVLYAVRSEWRISRLEVTPLESIMPPTDPEPEAQENRISALLKQCELGTSLDLLALPNLPNQLDVGQWVLKDGVLSSVPDGKYWLYFPYKLPEQYVIHAKLRRISGEEGYGIGLRMGSGGTMLVLDAWTGRFTGLNMIDGREVKYTANPTRLAINKFGRGEEREITIVVLSGRILASIDGETLIDWEGTPSQLSREASPPIGWEDSPMLLSVESEWRLSEYNLTPIESAPEAESGVTP